MRIGSICTGYGGLDLALEGLTGATTAWVADIDKGSCRVLAHRFPDAPNLGNLTLVDWTKVEPIEILTGGTPCQDLSVAGKRAGMTEGTRSNLWVVMREAIATLRPRVVIWENVGGAYSAAAASDLERVEGRLGDGPGRPALRALGRVLGDLATLGYDAEWHGIRAADIGAPHGRLRVFVVAYPQHDSIRGSLGIEVGGATPAGGGADAVRVLPTLIAGDALGNVYQGRGSYPRHEGDDLRTAVSRLLPTPRATDSADARGETTYFAPTLPQTIAAQERNLLPTPIVNDMGAGRSVDWWDEWAPRQKSSDGRPAPHGRSLSIELQRLLPTPVASDSTGITGTRPESAPPLNHVVTHVEDWGDFAEAILTWGALLGRPAPPPTVLGKSGQPELSARFAEWMMGLPEGWVTDVPEITNRAGIKLCGNGVVPQQAQAAVLTMAALDEIFRMTSGDWWAGYEAGWKAAHEQAEQILLDALRLGILITPGKEDHDQP